MKKLELVQMEGLEGGKFWGWSEWTATGDCSGGHQTIVRHYSTLWISVTYEYEIISC